VDTKSRKPSPEELLHELESIRDSLIQEDDGHGSSNNDNANTDSSAVTQERPAITDDDIPDDEDYDYLLDIPDNTDENSGKTPTVNPAEKPSDALDVLPGQQSLFSENESANLGQGSDTSALIDNEETFGKATGENPFLPKHMKDRLEKEKSLYQREIDAATKIPGLNPYVGKPDAEQALINELVKLYLPQIEEELRRRLHESIKQQKEGD